MQPGERLLQPVRAFAAGDAPAAALMLVELHRAQRKLDHAYGLVEHDHAPGAEQRSRLAHLVEVHADVDFFGQQYRRRRPAGHDGFQLLPARNAAAYVIDHLLEVVTHGQFIDARLLYVPTQAEQARSAVAFRAELGVFRAANAKDVRHRRQRFGVVDNRGTAIEPDHGREGRADARDAALAFERLHQRRLFAHFVGPGPSMRNGVEVDARSEDVLAEEALRVGVVDGLLHDL